MSWDSVEEWPSNGTSGVYRGAAEIIVAERSGLKLFERAVLWWHSTAELPYADIVQEVVVTPNYVYVRKQDGSQKRVRRDLLAQGSVEGRRRQYSVPNGTDMVLSDRKGDDVERALMGRDEVKGWTRPPRWGRTILVLLAMVWVAAMISDEYLREGAEHVAAGRYTSESAYWFYACIGAWALIVAGFFYYPERLIVDALGIRSVRGFLSGIRSTIPIEHIRFVEVQNRRVRSSNATLHFFPVYVHTTNRFRKRIKLRSFNGFGRNQAVDFGELCATTWDVELKSPEPAKTWDELLQGATSGKSK